jgi:hypothetical protein
MSGIKVGELSAFYRKLHARGENVTRLAERIHVSRPALTRVLNGARRRGPIWRRVLPLLSPAEVKLLDVAHSSPWNATLRFNRPRWSREKAEMLSQ